MGADQEEERRSWGREPRTLAHGSSPRLPQSAVLISAHERLLAVPSLTSMSGSLSPAHFSSMLSSRPTAWAALAKTLSETTSLSGSSTRSS